MNPPDSPFWRNVERFREMGLDPLRWIAGCSVAVDDELVLYPAISAARLGLEGMGVTIVAPEGPAVVEDRGHPLEVERVIVDPREDPAPYAASRGNARWASVMARVDRMTGDDPGGFSVGLVRALRGAPAAAERAGLAGRFDRPIVIGSLKAHATARPDTQFFAFDFCEPGTGTARGRSVVKSQALEITDASLDPMDPLHVESALAAALSPIIALGCHQDLCAWPILDAPTEAQRRSLRASFGAAALKAGVRVEDAPSPERNSLFIGATVAGACSHDLPNRHQDVAEGMEVLITRPFGDLAPLLVQLMARTEPRLHERAHAAGFRMSDIERQTLETHAALSTPALAVARTIADHRPPQGEPIQPGRHIAATVDLSLEGAVGLIRFAKRVGIEMRLDRLPLAYPELSQFATAEYLTDNATANAPGAIAIVAYPTALVSVEQQLAGAGLRPQRVGAVTGGAEGRLLAPAALASVVGSKRLLAGAHLT